VSGLRLGLGRELALCVILLALYTICASRRHLIVVLVIGIFTLTSLLRILGGLDLFYLTNMTLMKPGH
jgi:hypothetical protein